MARISIINAHRSAMTISPVSFYKHDSGSEMQLEIPSYRSSDSDPSPLHSVIFVCSNSPHTIAKLVEESFRLDAQLGGRTPLAFTLPLASHCTPSEAGTPVPGALPPILHLG